MTKVIVHPTPGENEFILRKGDALPAKADKSINIDGTLGAPLQFLTGKGDVFPTKMIHLQIYHDKGKLVLRMGDFDPYTEHVITGSLKRDSVLNSFEINSEKRWSIQEFLKFIKTMRYYFADRAQHAALVESIQKWSVKVERVIVEHNDNKGNSNFQLETKVQAVEGLISKFDLNIPIFQGYSKYKFTVEIGLDPKNTAVQIYLISDELIELEIGVREKLIAEEVAKFDSFAFSKVVVS
jgi:hypothetical protein